MIALQLIVNAPSLAEMMKRSSALRLGMAARELR
jgi:hypothetical protein